MFPPEARNVARLCNVSCCAVQFVQKGYQEIGIFSRRQGSGRNRKPRRGVINLLFLQLYKIAEIEFCTRIIKQCGLVTDGLYQSFVIGTLEHFSLLSLS